MGFGGLALFYSPGLPQIHYTAKDDLELLILLPPLPKYWAAVFRPHAWFILCWGWNGVLCMLGKLRTNQATSLDPL